MLQRLVLLLSVLLLSACALEPGEDAGEESEPTAQTEEAIVAGPEWRMATLVLRNVDAYFVADGRAHRAQSRMSADTAGAAKRAAEAVPAKFWSLNGGRAAARMTVIDVETPVTRLKLLSKERGYTIDAADIAGILDTYAPRGRYDSIFVAWDPNASTPDVPSCCAFGYGPSDASNGATYAVIQPFAMNAEAMIHEWLHGAELFYDAHGFDVPDPHENRDFGYWATTDGTWSHWYAPLMRGTLLRAGKVVGYTSQVWRSGTPRRWLGGSYSAPAKPALGQPSMRRAEAQAGHVYLEWNPVRRTSHYTEWVVIKRADGVPMRNVSRYVQPGVDRGSIDYDYFTKAEICAAARSAGVSLSSVRMTVEVWPDRNKDLATRMDVAGTYDCR